MPMETIVEMVKHNQSTTRDKHFVNNYDNVKQNIQQKETKFPAMN